jgi:hypothetical protein
MEVKMWKLLIRISNLMTSFNTVFLRQVYWKFQKLSPEREEPEVQTNFGGMWKLETPEKENLSILL